MRYGNNDGRKVRFWRHASWWAAITPAAGMLLAVVAGRAVQAHQVVTSKYNYNEHVFPILRDRCGRCHVDGSQTPMSLVTYNDAVPWAESIREQLVTEAMPPWYADPDGPAVKGGYGLSTKELDTVVTWAAGGTPRSTEGVFLGVSAPKGADEPAPFKPNLARWKLGPPDLAVKMPAEFNLPAGTAEETHDVTVPTGLTTEKWVKATDLLPGTLSMVRDAVISIENGPVLGAWVPGDDVVPTPVGTAFRLPAGAKLHLRIHYKKNWRDEAEAESDRSTIGLYFSEPPSSGRGLEAFALAAPEGGSTGSSPYKFGETLETDARVVGLRPSVDRPYTGVEIEATMPTGNHVELLRLRAPQPQFYRRYWLVDAVSLPKGTKVEITATPLTSSADDVETKVPKQYPLAVALDYAAP